MSKEPKKVTKPSHEPTKATRELVQLHTMVGTRQETIAEIIGIDPKKRFYTHEKECQSYNPDLAKIEKEYVIILEANPSNISESEKKFIKKYRKKIVNSAVASKYEHGKGAKPWSIGQGKITPSKMLLRILATEDPCSANKIRKEIRSMADAQRCAFETSIFMHSHVLMKNRLAEWYNSCRDKMLKCMIDSYGEVK